MLWIAFLTTILAIAATLLIAIGLKLPKKHLVSRRVYINRSPVEVWEVITDYAGQVDWRTEITHVERLPDRNGHPFWRETDNRGQSVDIETIESFTPYRLSRKIANENLGFGSTWMYDISEYGEVIALTISEQGEVSNPAFRFINRFIIGHTSALDKYLEALAKKLKIDVTIVST